MGISPVRQEERAVDNDAAVVGDGLWSHLSPTLGVLGRATLVVVVYATVLYAAAVLVGAVLVVVPGFVGAILLFSAGVALVGAVPSVAHWTLTRVLGRAR